MWWLTRLFESGCHAQCSRKFPITLTSIRKPVRILYLYCLYWFNIGGKFTAYSCLFCYSLVNPLYLLTDCNTILVGVCMYACMHAWMHVYIYICMIVCIYICTGEGEEKLQSLHVCANDFGLAPVSLSSKHSASVVTCHLWRSHDLQWRFSRLDSSYVLPAKDSPRKG